MVVNEPEFSLSQQRYGWTFLKCYQWISHPGQSRLLLSFVDKNEYHEAFLREVEFPHIIISMLTLTNLSTMELEAGVVLVNS